MIFLFTSPVSLDSYIPLEIHCTGENKKDISSCEVSEYWKNKKEKGSFETLQAISKTTGRKIHVRPAVRSLRSAEPNDDIRF